MKTTFVATAFAALLAGCLPRGQAPAGRRWLPSRTVEQVLFAPGPAGEPARLLTTRRGVNTQYSQGVDVYGVSPPVGEGTFGSEKLLLEHVINNNAGSCVDPSCTLTTDSRGRLWLTSDQSTPTATAGIVDVKQPLIRVDPLTGDSVEIDREGSVVGISPDRRTYAYRSGQTLVLRDVDDREVRLGTYDDARFVGADLYVVADGTLTRLRPPYDTKEELARNVDSFAVIYGPTTLLALCRRAELGPCAGALLDPATDLETPLPPDIIQLGNLSMSSTGRYLFGFDWTAGNYESQILSLYDRQTGTVQSAMVDGTLSVQKWRPGRDEIWFSTEIGSSGPDPAFQAPPSYSSWRWRPGEEPSKVGDAPFFIPFTSFASYEAYLRSSWPFTSDGRFWLSYSLGGDVGDKPPVLLRAADDPSAAPLRLNPKGTGLENLWQLADGRLIVEARISNPKRCDIHLVDPVARTTRQVGHSGNVVATGTPALLAENVHAAVVERTAAADALAPGTRVAYISRHRIESPYDGLWVTELP